MLNHLENKKSINTYILNYLALCTFFFVFIEIVHRQNINSILSFFFETQPLTLIYLYTFFIFSSTYVFIFKKPLLFATIHYSIWIIIALISNINNFFKGSPLVFEDLFLASEAGNIMSKYLNKNLIINFLAILFCIILVLVICLKLSKNFDFQISKNKIITILFIPFFLIIYLNSMKILFQNGKNITYTLSDFNIVDTYQKNGFLYSFNKTADLFLVNFTDNDYDLNLINQIKKSLNDTNDFLKTYEGDKNIILIQLESVFDPLNLKEVELSSDPLLNFRKISKENTSGSLIVPVIGGGTTQTEFEILTGINIKKLYTRMPYLNLLNFSPAESFSHILSKYGFETTAIHNYFSTFYNRTKAYENLGFNNFIPLESMSQRDRNQNFWYKDTLLIDEIIQKIKNSKNKDFIFGVTVEAHGPYNTKIDGDITVKSSILNETEILELQNYVNILKNVDQFIISLIDALNQTNEEYILILYSDHLPALGNSSSTFNKTLDENKLFTTMFTVIDSTSNKKMSFNGKTLYSYELLGEVFRELNLENTVYEKVRHLYKNNENYDYIEKNLLLDLKSKNFNIYENNEFPYKISEIIIGNDSPNILSIQNKDNKIEIHGENFTENCKIYINKKQVKTNFISENLLVCDNLNLNNNDTVVSILFSNKNSPLRVGNEFTFKE